MEEKTEVQGEILKELNQTKADLEKTLSAQATKELNEKSAAIEEKIQAVDAKIEEVKNAPKEVTKEEIKAILDDLAVTIKSVDRLNIAQKNGKQAQPEQTKTFNEILGETIKDNADKIQNFKSGMPEQRFQMKAVGDMSIGANFPTSGTFSVDVRNQLIPQPFNRVWLGDVLPQGTSNGTSILYPKENGGEGGAALWTDHTADKAQMDFDLTGQNAYFKWIAGFVIIEREMLDDIPFLQSYLQNKMLISLKIAENNFILNGSTDSNPVDGFLDVATAYDGTFSADVDKIVDAAWGQLVESTFDFYNPTNLILTPRSSVRIGLNKASGSGEYNLPEPSATVGAQGLLNLTGLQTVRTTEIGAGNFIVFDRAATMFIKKMQPELRMFEDATLAKRNKIMFRVEERATLAIFNNNAIVKGTISTGS